MHLSQIDPNSLNKQIFSPTLPNGSPNPFVSVTNPASFGTIINELVKYLFPFVGLMLFVYLLFGGFSYLTSGGDPKGMEKAQGQITNAIVGFVIVFLAYWVVQIFEFIFNIKVF